MACLANIECDSGQLNDESISSHCGAVHTSWKEKGVSVMTVLIVDDEANIRKFAAANLSRRGYRVIEAGDAEEGLERLRHGTGDDAAEVLLLDIKLPGMSGWNLLDAMASDPEVPQNIPVVIMTASVTDASISTAAYPNVVEVLVKPVSTDQLLRAVQNAFSRVAS
jgi:CheY-like chemotaxis protein